MPADLQTFGFVVITIFLLLYRFGSWPKITAFVKEAVSSAVEGKFKSVEERVERNTDQIAALRRDVQANRNGLVQVVWENANNLSFFTRPPKARDIENAIESYKNILDYRRLLGKDDLDAT